MGTNKVAMIIASTIFRDEELFVPKKIIEDAGYAVTIVSSKKGVSKGRMGGNAIPEMLISEMNVADFDGVIFVGGPGAKEYWSDPVAHNIARLTMQSNKALGAICIASVTLLEAGLLKGKKATAYSSEIEKLKAGGVNVPKEFFTRDGNIITANGPESASEFGKLFVICLTELKQG